jgi:peptidoglycan/LPS O-acetylase OafA/YrhL
MHGKLFLTQAEMPALRGSVPSLDGLRAISIIIVLCSHLWSAEYIPGGLGVYVFFVISGFLITRLLMAEHRATDHVSLPHFYARRILRLYPVIIVFSAFFITVYTVQGRPYDPLEPISALGYFANYYYVYLDTHGVDPSMPPFGLFWSLSVEEHFYLLFPLTFVLLKGDASRLTRMLVLLCAGCLCLRLITRWLYASPDLSYRLYNLSQYRLDSIGFGVIIALLCDMPRGREFLLRLTHPAALLLAMLTILAVLLVRNQWFRDTLRYSIEGGAISVLVVGILFSDRYWLAQWLLNTALLRWIGRLSYSLYVWHDGVIWLLPVKALPISAWQQSGVTVVACFAVAALSYYAVEQPFLKLRKYFSQNRPLLVPDTPGNAVKNTVI